ncbi:MAG: hypothetical protein OXH22_08700 [Chloroflexi bacterium]|nr:hypothetical protein [Chloroflexota bacterium]
MSDILFVCVHNAGRSQMAKAFFNKFAEDAGISSRSESAGTEPAERPHAIVAEAMREVGLDISAVKPRIMTNADVEHAERVITMGCAVDADTCPALLLICVEDWGLPDPANEALPQVRFIRDEVERRVSALVDDLQTGE